MLQYGRQIGPHIFYKCFIIIIPIREIPYHELPCRTILDLSINLENCSGSTGITPLDNHRYCSILVLSIAREYEQINISEVSSHLSCFSIYAFNLYYYNFRRIFRSLHFRFSEVLKSGFPQSRLLIFRSLDFRFSEVWGSAHPARGAVLEAGDLGGGKLLDVDFGWTALALLDALDQADALAGIQLGQQLDGFIIPAV